MDIKKNIPWEDYADEHMLYLRPYDNEVDPKAFEGILVDVGENGAVRFIHNVVFMDDYLVGYKHGQPNRIDSILSEFGYKNLDDFVSQNASGGELVYKENGDIDREKSPGYIIDLHLLASLIFEHQFGDIITPEAAAEAVKRLVGEDLTGFIHELGEKSL
ncbi:hypothetical protein [Flavonifractor sp. An306]|uniref:hypothetical protein n=1 Tax=Flavonifractor sp. An306 TaxID=1965629 RepID=UPI00174DDB51|nr:hypothetical protein [Flavonifractor sp. An306]